MSLIDIDTLDDRREIYRLLDSLLPESRLACLRHFCRKVESMGVRPQAAMGHAVAYARRSDEADSRLTREVYNDFALLITQYQLDPLRTAKELEEWVRRSGRVK